MNNQQKFNLKKVEIVIEFRDPLDLKQAILKTIENFENGEQITEFKHLTANVAGKFNYLEWSDFEEIEINGVWCRVFKSKI